MSDDELRCPFTGVQWNDRRARAAVLRAVYMADVESDGWEEVLADDILERLRGDEHLPGRRSLTVADSLKTNQGWAGSGYGSAAEALEDET